MEAKYTVMSENRINIKWDTVIGYPCQQKLITKSELENLLETQAEISFRAGIKEVVEWVSENLLGFVYDYNPKRLQWQAKLKEWGIE